MTALDMRRRSRALLQGAGYPVHDQLPPLLETDGVLRPARVLADRALALYAFLLFLDGGDAYREPIGRWLSDHALWQALTPQERSLIEARGTKLTDAQKDHGWRGVEALYALCWALGKVNELPVTAAVPDDLVTCLPACGDSDEGWGIDAPSSFYSAALRPVDEVLQMLDVYYCVHWAVVEERRLAARPKRKVPAWVLVERRRALEWMVSSSAWEDIELDT